MDDSAAARGADTASDTDDYENLDLSFDDIQGFPGLPPPAAAAAPRPPGHVYGGGTNGSSHDPTVFSKPGAKHVHPDLEEEYILGTLVVRVVAARDLEPAETVGLGNLLFGGHGKHSRGGTANPYASVRFGETTQRTSTIYKTLNPTWPRGETMYMDVTHPPCETPPAPVGEATEQGDAPAGSAAPSSLASQSARSSFSDANDSIDHDHGFGVREPILSVAIFHASDVGHKSHKSDHQRLYNPTKKHSHGDSDDVFLGMLTVDMTPLITGKIRTLDEWVPLSGGSRSARASVRVVAEYEASDPPPRRGDLVRFTQFCNPVDLYPALVDGYYNVAEDSQGAAGDNVLISYTSAEGWVSTFLCHRYMLICVERHTSNLDHLENEVISIAQRLSVSPAAQAVQESLARVPDDGLIGVGASVVQGATSLWGRWAEGGFNTAIEDIANATNWDGRFNPSTADHLSESFEHEDEEETVPRRRATSDMDSLLYSDDSDMTQSPLGQILPNMPSCPITQAPMRDPVVAADGHTYERAAIVRWLKTSDKSPLTGSLLPHKNLVPNYMLLSSLQESAKNMAPPSDSVARQVSNGSMDIQSDDEDLRTMDVKID